MPRINNPKQLLIHMKDNMKFGWHSKDGELHLGNIPSIIRTENPDDIVLYSDIREMEQHRVYYRGTSVLYMLHYLIDLENKGFVDTIRLVVFKYRNGKDPDSAIMFHDIGDKKVYLVNFVGGMVYSEKYYRDISFEKDISEYVLTLGKQIIDRMNRKLKCDDNTIYTKHKVDDFKMDAIPFGIKI